MTLGGDRAAGIVYAAVYGFAFLGALAEIQNSVAAVERANNFAGKIQSCLKARISKAETDGFLSPFFVTSEASASVCGSETFWIDECLLQTA